MLGLLWIALLVGGYFAYQSAPRRAPFIVRVRGQAGYEVWIFNVRDMCAELRENAYTRNARVRYDLRRKQPHTGKCGWTRWRLHRAPFSSRRAA